MRLNTHSCLCSWVFLGVPQVRFLTWVLGFLFSVVAQGESASPAAFLLGCPGYTTHHVYLRVPHPSRILRRVGSYDRTPRSFFSLLCPGAGCPRCRFCTWVLGSSCGTDTPDCALGVPVLLGFSSLRTSAPSAPLRYLFLRSCLSRVTGHGSRVTHFFPINRNLPVNALPCPPLNAKNCRAHPRYSPPRSDSARPNKLITDPRTANKYPRNRNFFSSPIFKLA